MRNWMRSGLGGRTIIKPVRTSSKGASLFPKCIIIYIKAVCSLKHPKFPIRLRQRTKRRYRSQLSETLRGGAVVARQVNKLLDFFTGRCYFIVMREILHTVCTQIAHKERQNLQKSTINNKKSKQQRQRGKPWCLCCKSRKWAIKKELTLGKFLNLVGSGGWNRTNGLQVMSLTSYHCSTPQRLLRNIIYYIFWTLQALFEENSMFFADII